MKKDTSVYTELLSLDRDMIDFILGEIKDHPDLNYQGSDLLSKKEQKQAEKEQKQVEKVMKYIRCPKGRRPKMPEVLESVFRDSIG